MAENKKAGRPKGSTNKKNEVNNNTDNELIKQLMEQVANLTKQVEESKNEKNALQQLVDTLQSSSSNKVENELPSKVKVISLLENQLNLSTQPNGAGKVYSFSKLGDSKIIRLQDIEDILSIIQYREQAEKGYFYICDSKIVEEFGLTEAYENILDEKTIKQIETLSTDNSVDLFLGLNDSVKISIARKMAEDISNGIKLDRNKIEDIRVATNIDIEKMATEFKEFKDKDIV